MSIKKHKIIIALWAIFCVIDCEHAQSMRQRPHRKLVALILRGVNGAKDERYTVDGRNVFDPDGNLINQRSSGRSARMLYDNLLKWQTAQRQRLQIVQGESVSLAPEEPFVLFDPESVVPELLPLSGTTMPFPSLAPGEQFVSFDPEVVPEPAAETQRPLHTLDSEWEGIPPQ